MIKSLGHLKKRTKLLFSVATPLCNISDKVTDSFQEHIEKRGLPLLESGLGSVEK